MLEFINFLGQYIFTFILHICGNGKFPKPLSEEKEKEYLLKSKNGDIKARNILVEHNLRLVAHIIKKYYAVNVDQDDLVSIGTIGLIKAINTFDMDKNIKLSSYASRCIENEILMHFRNLKKSSQNVSLEDAVDIDNAGHSDQTDVLREGCCRRYAEQRGQRRTKAITDDRSGKFAVGRFPSKAAFGNAGGIADRFDRRYDKHNAHRKDGAEVEMERNRKELRKRKPLGVGDLRPVQYP